MPRRIGAFAVVAAGLIASLAACGAPRTPAVETSLLGASAADARAAGVDAAQIAILESGAVGFEDYELAMTRAYECMRGAGAVVEVLGVKKYHGVTILDATTEASDEQLGLVDDCYERHAHFVGAYWQVSSPDAISYAERRAVALKPLLQECLTEKGIDWPDDASFDELGNLAFSPGHEADESNCLDDVGYSEWDG